MVRGRLEEGQVHVEVDGSRDAPHVGECRQPAIAVGAEAGRLSPQQTIGESDVFMRAYGPDGALRWTRRFGGPGVDRANAVAAGPHGEILLAGAVQSVLPGQESFGGLDAFIRMYR